MTGGRWITRERWATTGKVAAKELVVQIMKREATRRPSKEVSPPPEPQSGEDMLGGEARGARGDVANQDHRSYNLGLA